MSRRKWYAAAAVVIVVAVALGLVLGLTGGGQKQSTEGAQASLASAGMPSEGIQVHGHWTIDVKNPDGSLASHHEFENAYVGGIVLSYFMGGYRSTGTMEVDLTASSPSGNLAIIESSCPHSTPPPGYFYNPQKSVPSIALHLHGTAQAVVTTSIVSVSTVVYSCSSNVLPSACNCSNGSPFQVTLTTLPQPIPVQQDQEIVVNIDISFS